MSKPQRVCGHCQRVALTGSPYCNFHTRQSRTDRARRAVSVRLTRYLPENCDLNRIIEPLDARAAFSPEGLPTEVDAATRAAHEVTAANIARSADSVTRAIFSNRIDAGRARFFLYSLQLSRNLRRQISPTDPHLPAANRAINDLILALNTLKGSRKGIPTMT